jgi:pyruvate,orthophosphate dikinase
MGKCCVSGTGTIKIDYKKKLFTVGDLTIKQGDLITINGSTGEVMLGKIPTIQPALSGDFAEVMKWADETRTLKVRCNAETPLDAETARRFGAEGIGLCRTEHMFFEADRIPAMREMILAEDEEGRRKALAKLQPMQKKDFTELFKIMGEFPVTIRLLDPPLHEFLPHSEAEMQEVAKMAGVTLEKVRQRAAALHESNPMLGHRGCRLGITYPEIYEMQAKAIFEAAQETGAKPEIMIPLAFSKKELSILQAVIDAAHKATAPKVEYKLGTMIELPRAALKAGEIAEVAEFFSFGTNDLTQTSMGISRDDSANFIDDYKAKGIVENDPFAVLDVDGVGELIKIAAERGRATRKDIKLGICGEHGGNPASIQFCQEVGLDYVSCSPYRVPIARLAAAQAALKFAAAKKKAA